jgi:hypothetical protein
MQAGIGLLIQNQKALDGLTGDELDFRRLEDIYRQ